MKPLIDWDSAGAGNALKKQKKMLKVLSGVEVGRAQASALNKAAAKVTTATIKDSAKSLKMKSSDIRYTSVTSKKKRIKLSRANSKKQMAVLDVNGSKVLLGKLKPRQLKSGVKVGRTTYKGAFIATPSTNPTGSTKGRGNLPSGLIGKQQVFERKGKKRYGLKAKYKWVKSTTQAIMNKKSREMMAKEVPIILKREYEFRINKALAKVK